MSKQKSNRSARGLPSPSSQPAMQSPKMSQKRPSVGSAAVWSSPNHSVEGAGMSDLDEESLSAIVQAEMLKQQPHGSPLSARSQRMEKIRAESLSNLESGAAATRAFESLTDRYGSLSRRAVAEASAAGESLMERYGSLSRRMMDAAGERRGTSARSQVASNDLAGEYVGGSLSSMSRLNAGHLATEDEHSGSVVVDNKFGSLDRTAAMRYYGYRDRSLERSGEYAHSSRVQRNRSLDRDYPLLAVSSHSLEWCAAEGNDDGSSTASKYASQSQSLLMLKLQTQMLELNKELTGCQKELEQNKSQLNSYIASVKTFWSPELKKERASRKEEAAKAARFAEQLRQLQNDKQISQVRMQNLEDRLNLAGLREDLNASAGGGGQTGVAGTNGEMAKRERERLDKEVSILRKTVEEMELRIDIQKKTLTARDASVKKLVEMLQSKVAGGAVGGMTVASVLNGEAELDQLRNEVAALERKLQQSEESRQELASKASKLQEAVDASKSELREVQSSLNRVTRDSKNLEDLQSLMDLKNTRIADLESEVKGLESEVTHMRNSGQPSDVDRQHLEALHSHEKLLKSKIESLKVDVTAKTSEILTLRSKVETQESQNLDHVQHVDVLKQQIETKAKTHEMQQSEIHDLHNQVKEKAGLLERKTILLENVKSEKLRLENVASELKLALDTKEKKLGSLEKKVASLEQQLSAKVEELESVRTTMSSLLSQTSNTNSAVSSLEEALIDKDRVVERLKKDMEEAVHAQQEEVSALESAAVEQRQRASSLTRDLSEKQAELLELRGELCELRADRLKEDSRLHQLESSGAQVARELDELRSAYDKLTDERTSQSENIVRLQGDVEAARQEAIRSGEQSSNAQTEVDRLHDVIKTMESEVHAKATHVTELQEQLQEAKQKYASARRSQHIERTPSGGGDEVKQRTGGDSDLNGDAQINTALAGATRRQLEERVEELEEALRQSVRITAERELVLAEHRRQLERTDRQLIQARTELSIMRAYDRTDQTRELEEALRDKDEQLRKMASERTRHTEEAYEMKQEAILAALSEKDTHIALLETSKAKNAREEIEKLNHEKRKLNDKLKELTRQRMMLVVERSSDNARKLANAEELSQQR